VLVLALLIVVLVLVVVVLVLLLWRGRGLKGTGCASASSSSTTTTGAMRRKPSRSQPARKPSLSEPARETVDRKSRAHLELLDLIALRLRARVCELRARLRLRRSLLQVCDRIEEPLASAGRAVTGATTTTATTATTSTTITTTTPVESIEPRLRHQLRPLLLRPGRPRPRPPQVREDGRKERAVAIDEDAAVRVRAHLAAMLAREHVREEGTALERRAGRREPLAADI
jgi:hypothetical protein